MRDSDKYLVFKIATIIMLLLMVVRHAMFYIHFGYINTEMGYDQSVFGVLLIPVTASFGFLLFFSRYDLEFTLSRLFSFALVASLPIILSFAYKGPYDVFTYSIYDHSRRPPFLILLPIGLAALFAMLPLRRFWVVSSICIVVFTAPGNFVAHYFCMFTAYRVVQNTYVFNQRMLTYIAMPCYSVVCSAVILFRIERVPAWIEFGFAIFYVSTIYAISQYFSSFMGGSQRACIQQTKIRILPFYIAQAGLFTMWARQKVGTGFILDVLTILTVFVLSLSISIWMSRVTAGGGLIRMWLYNYFRFNRRDI